MDAYLSLSKTFTDSFTPYLCLMECGKNYEGHIFLVTKKMHCYELCSLTKLLNVLINEVTLFIFQC